jgi:hypothetical protein
MIVAIILIAVIVIAIKKSSGWESIEITKYDNKDRYPIGFQPSAPFNGLAEKYQGQKDTTRVKRKYVGTSWCSCGAGVKHDKCI